MKKVSLLLAFVGFLFLTACHNQASKGNAVSNAGENSAVSDTAQHQLPVMTFDETVHNFGNMVQGEVGKYNFHFRNTGKANLVIKGIETTCGCTVGSYPHHPIKPGEEGNLTVTFNSSFKEGYQNKGVMITANTDPNQIVLYIRAQVSLPRNNN